ncbi:hypothetical protein TIFTF001_024276 [Ficus carica]|uniref:Uncharacterized protein n=1 Tax=Ficus carica TaxID=3494 RepID=A0AA88AM96_FICCA|nr:hypothetical protein TIFTF001_024276 [Ficus carica]
MADRRPWPPAGGERRPGLAAPNQASRDCKCSHDKARVLGTLAGPMDWATQPWAGPASSLAEAGAAGWACP